MKVWTNNTFDGHWPVGTAAVVVADTSHRAAELLENALAEAGLHQTIDPGKMILLATTDEHALILRDGEY